LGFRAGARRSCRRTMSARSRFAWASRARGPREAAGGRRSCRFSRPANPCKPIKPFARLGMERHAVLPRERILRKSAIFQRPAGKAAAALRASLRFFKCAPWQGCASEGGQVRLRPLASTLSRSRSRPACQAAERPPWTGANGVRRAIRRRPLPSVPRFPSARLRSGRRLARRTEIFHSLTCRSDGRNSPRTLRRGFVWRVLRFGILRRVGGAVVGSAGVRGESAGRNSRHGEEERGRCATPRHPAAVRRNVSRT